MMCRAGGLERVCCSVTAVVVVLLSGVGAQKLSCVLYVGCLDEYTTLEDYEDDDEDVDTTQNTFAVCFERDFTSDIHSRASAQHTNTRRYRSKQTGILSIWQSKHIRKANKQHKIPHIIINRSYTAKREETRA